MSLASRVLPRFIWAVAFLCCGLWAVRFGKDTYNFHGDALGYYMYLPSTFIYGNELRLEELPKDRGIPRFIHVYAAQIGENRPRTPKGYIVNQYNYGVALMEAPFFFAAHSLEKATGGLANGFTAVYQWAIALSTVVYAVLGLWLTYRLLRRYIPRHIASLTTALLLIGTNLFWFTVQQHGMAHVPLFFLFACLLHLTVRVHEHARTTDFLLLGVVAGLITVIRAVDGLCVLPPLLYAAGRPWARTKAIFLWQHWHRVLAAAGCFIAVFVPQLLYWRWLTGHFFYDAYGPNQRLDLVHAHLGVGLFSASNGWLAYTPLMALALAGLFFRRRLGPFALALPLTLALYVWVVYAWYIPNYINGFGSRPMVDVYALLALPLGAFLEWISKRRLVVRIATAVFITTCVALNLIQSLQQRRGILISETSSYRYNFQTLFRDQLRYSDLVVWDIQVPQPSPLRLRSTGPIVRTAIADSSFSDRIVQDSTGPVYLIGASEEYTPLALRLPLDTLRAKEAHWLRCSVRAMAPEPVYSIFDNHLLVVQVRRGADIVHWYGLRLNNKFGLLETPSVGERPALLRFRENVWGTVAAFIPVPADARPGDVLQLDIWNYGRKPLRVSEIRVEGFR